MPTINLSVSENDMSIKLLINQLVMHAKIIYYCIIRFFFFVNDSHATSHYVVHAYIVFFEYKLNAFFCQSKLNAAAKKNQ